MKCTTTAVATAVNKHHEFRVEFKQWGTTYQCTLHINLSLDLTGDLSYLSFEHQPVLLVDYTEMAKRVARLAGVTLSRRELQTVEESLREVVPSRLSY